MNKLRFSGIVFILIALAPLFQAHADPSNFAGSMTCVVKSPVNENSSVQVTLNGTDTNSVNSIDYTYSVADSNGRPVSKTLRIYSTTPQIRGAFLVNNCETNANTFITYNSSYSLYSKCTSDQTSEYAIINASFRTDTGGYIIYTASDTSQQKIKISGCIENR